MTRIPQLIARLKLNAGACTAPAPWDVEALEKEYAQLCREDRAMADFIQRECGLTIIPENIGVRPQSMSYVKPSELKGRGPLIASANLHQLQEWLTEFLNLDLSTQERIIVQKLSERLTAFRARWGNAKQGTEGARGPSQSEGSVRSRSTTAPLRQTPLRPEQAVRVFDLEETILNVTMTLPKSNLPPQLLRLRQKLERECRPTKRQKSQRSTPVRTATRRGRKPATASHNVPRAD